MSELFSPFQEDDFDYELNEDKLVSFEEIHSMVERGETKNIIETRPSMYLLMG